MAPGSDLGAERWPRDSNAELPQPGRRLEAAELRSRQSTLSVTQFACSAARAGGNRRSARLRPALATLPPPRDTRTAMSVENVASFQRAVEATNRGDVAGVLRELDPAVEFQNTFEEAFGGRGVDYRGHDGIRDFFHDFVETLAEFRFDSTNVQDLGDQLLAVGHIRGRDNQDGRKIELSVCVLCDFADGKIVRVLTYFDPVDSPEGPPNILESTGRRN